MTRWAGNSSWWKSDTRMLGWLRSRRKVAGPRSPAQPDFERETGTVDPRHPEPPVLAAVENGILRLLPGSPSRPALLRPGPGVLLKVNGEPVQRAAAVTAKDQVEVEVVVDDLEDGVGRPPFSLSVAEDRSQAVLRLHPVRRRILRDVPPSRVVTLEVEERSELPPDVTVQAIVEALAGAGVVAGIDEEAVRVALMCCEPEPVVVARARPPVPGRNGRVEVLPTVTPARPGRSAGQSGYADRVDYWEHRLIPTVEAGDVFAVVLPPTAGVPGWDVTGQDLAAPAGRPAEVTCGDGVIRRPRPDGSEELVAALGGRPRVQRLADCAWRVDVVPVLVHRGDVDLASGNIRFRGDVVVLGHVLERARVVALGDVRVEGNVDGAVIQADGDVAIQGAAFRSRVVAGARGAVYRDLLVPLSDFVEAMQQLVQAMAIVRRAASFRMEDLKRVGPWRLVRLLVEFKFPRLPKLASRVRDVLEAYDAELDAPVERLRRPVGDLAEFRIGDRFDAEALAAWATEALRFLKAYRHWAGGSVSVGYAHFSLVRAGDCVHVGTRGTYHSRIRAGKDVRVQGPVVGGAVEAETRVVVLEAGAPAGPLTVLAVGPQGSIRAGRAHPNVWLRAGPRSRRVTALQLRVRMGAGTLRGNSVE